MKFVEVNNEVSYRHFLKKVKFAKNVEFQLSFKDLKTNLVKLEEHRENLKDCEDWSALEALDSSGTLKLSYELGGELIDEIMNEIKLNPSFLKKAVLGYFHPYHFKYYEFKNGKIIHTLSFVDDDDPRKEVKL